MTDLVAGQAYRDTDQGFYTAIDLKIAKSVTSSGPYAAGSTVTFSLVASNNGPATAQPAIVVKDRLPVGLTYVSASGTNWSCTATGQDITCTRDSGASTLAAGASAETITVTATVQGTASGTLTNYAQVNPAANETLAETNPLGSTNGGFETGDPSVGSNNDASASVSLTGASYGDYVWHDANRNGVQDEPAANGLNGVTVQLYQDVDGDGNPATGTQTLIGSQTTANDGAGNPGYYLFSNLNPGKYYAVFTAPAAYPLASPANQGGDDTKDSDATLVAGKLQSHVTTLVAGQAYRDTDQGFYTAIDLKIAKSVTSSGPYAAGSTVSFSLVASNNGPAAAQPAIVVKDQLPAGLTYVSATGTNWSCSASGQDITCTRSGSAAALAAGASADAITVTATVQGTASGTLTNVAQVNPAAGETLAETNPLGSTNGGYETGDPTVGSNNDASAIVPLTAVIDLSIAKTVVSTGPYRLGDVVTYNLVAKNNGPATAQPAIVVKDQLPAGLSVVSVTGTNWTCSPTTGAGPLEVVCTRSASAAPLVAGATAEVITLKAVLVNVTQRSLVNYALVSPAANETLKELKPIGSANSGYEDGSPATGSNNDDSTSIDLSTQPPQSIPTLQEWAMVLLALLLGGLAMQQRRQGGTRPRR